MGSGAKWEMGKQQKENEEEEGGERAELEEKLRFLAGYFLRRGHEGRGLTIEHHGQGRHHWDTNQEKNHRLGKEEKGQIFRAHATTA